MISTSARTQEHPIIMFVRCAVFQLHSLFLFIKIWPRWLNTKQQSSTLVLNLLLHFLPLHRLPVGTSPFTSLKGWPALQKLVRSSFAQTGRQHTQTQRKAAKAEPPILSVRPFVCACVFEAINTCLSIYMNLPLPPHQSCTVTRPREASRLAGEKEPRTSQRASRVSLQPWTAIRPCVR